MSSCQKTLLLLLLLEFASSQILCIEEEVAKYSENEGNDIYNVERQHLYAVKARSVRSSPATNYFKSWNRYLSRRSNGYGNVDEPNVDIGLLITVGGLGIAILAVAFALNDLSNQIDDNKDDLSSIKTDTTTLSNLLDDFSEEQANVCKLVDDITSVDISMVADPADPMADEIKPILSKILGFSVSCSDD